MRIHDCRFIRGRGSSYSKFRAAFRSPITRSISPLKKTGMKAYYCTCLVKTGVQVYLVLSMALSVVVLALVLQVILLIFPWDLLCC